MNDAIGKSNEQAQRMLDDPNIPDEMKVRLRRILQLGTDWVKANERPGPDGE